MEIEFNAWLSLQINTYFYILAVVIFIWNVMRFLFMREDCYLRGATLPPLVTIAMASFGFCGSFIFQLFYIWIPKL